jgi:hypothetical protein
MADTNTPNISLLLPDLNDTFNFGAHVENNFTTIDSLMGAVQCTSSSRPSNTYAGQIVYETDSHRYAQNTGTKASPAWTYMSHGAIATTSGSLPTSGLSNGFLVYATDLNALLVCDGGVLRYKTNVAIPSSAHPTAVEAGATIFETDTGLSAVYNGSNWMYAVDQIAPTQTLGSTTASVTFSGIPAIGALMVRWGARCSDAVTAEQLYVQLNGDTGNNYVWQANQANNTNAVSGTTGGTAVGKIQVATVPGGSATSTYWGSGSFTVEGSAQSGHGTTLVGTAFAATGVTNTYAGVYGGFHSTLGPVTSITIFGASGSLIAGSQFSLYGMV